ncbi:RES domain-containing protein [Acinetobacter baumannii]|uniref:RES domain-containing protein n=1 Tax=Acinetobacter baumannii TaxID=470 RepID=UPI00387DC83E
MFKSIIEKSLIEKRIEEFQNEPRNTLTAADCINKLNYVFGNIFSFPCEHMHYPKDVHFFRARPIPENDNSYPFNTIKTISDAWEPPPQFVKNQGRLNAPGQSILYCCPGDPFLAIKEARADQGNFVALMKYRTKKVIAVSVLGWFEKTTLPKDHMTQLFYSFLDKEFSTDVLVGEEYRYTLTRIIADTFYNYPNQDAWAYRSVQSREKCNIAFLPGKSKECLELVGVMICDLRKSTQNSLIVNYVMDFDLEGNAQAHAIGSPEQKRLFPELT